MLSDARRRSAAGAESEPIDGIIGGEGLNTTKISLVYIGITEFNPVVDHKAGSFVYYTTLLLIDRLQAIAQCFGACFKIIGTDGNQQISNVLRIDCQVIYFEILPYNDQLYFLQRIWGNERELTHIIGYCSIRCTVNIHSSIRNRCAINCINYFTLKRSILSEKGGTANGSQ